MEKDGDEIAGAGVDGISESAGEPFIEKDYK